MIGDEEFNIGILYLSVLDSKMSINECIAKSGLTADQISNIISIPKFQKYFDKEIDEELLIFCKTDWITEDIRKHIALSDSESEILEKVITENLMNHISKYWKEGEKVKRDFETRNLSEWIISEFVFCQDSPCGSEKKIKIMKPICQAYSQTQLGKILKLKQILNLIMRDSI